MHKIELRSKNPDKISTGANTELYIDGQKAKGVKSFKYEVDARGVGIVTVQYFGSVAIDSNIPSIVAEEILLETPLVQEMGNLEQTRTKDKGEQ